MVTHKYLIVCTICVLICMICDRPTEYISVYPYQNCQLIPIGNPVGMNWNELD